VSSLNPAPVPRAAAQSNCETCGQAARVRVHDGYRDGEPIIRAFCLPCAGDIPARKLEAPRRKRLGLHVLIGVTGIILGFVGLFADVVVPQAAPGFGIYQKSGVALGLVVIFLGSLLRVDVLALIGVFALVGAASIDHFGIVRKWGIGWEQQVLLVVAVACVAIGVFGQVMRRRQEADASEVLDGEEAE
jgi:hypothetical protein